MADQPGPAPQGAAPTAGSLEARPTGVTNMPPKTNDYSFHRTEEHSRDGPGARPPVSGMKLDAPGGVGPAKAAPAGASLAGSVPHTSSSMRDTQATAPSRIFSSPRGSGEKDEYLMRLLSKGAQPTYLHHSSSMPGSSAGFRVPDPVPQQRGSLARPPAAPVPPSARRQGASAPSGAQATTGTDSGARPRSARGQQASAWSFADTQRCMGADAAAALRATVIGHQVTFLEQLFDFHRAVAVQKLLVRHCPEVKQVMSQAEKILRASSSARDPSTRAAKRQRQDGAAEPPTASEEKALHPDSQFAALPLSRETAAGDGSGDDGDGSGGNGSGGGSTSPQPQVVLPPILGVPGLQPTPSGASQTPLHMLWQQHAQMPHMMMQHPAYWAQQAGAAMPQQYGGGGQAQVPYGMMGGDQLAWWYHEYYGRQAMAGQGGGGGPLQGPLQMQAQLQQQQQQQQLAMQAAAAMQGMQGGGAPGGAQPSGGPTKWWQDAQQTFGPPVDPEAIARATAAMAAATRRGRGGAGDSAAVEVESAPPAKGATRPQQQPREGSAAATDTAAGATTAAEAGPAEGKAARLVAPPRRRRHKRKPADPIAEASSGTTGLNHNLGPHSVQDDAHHAPADANVAKLLLSFSGKGGGR